MILPIYNKLLLLDFHSKDIKIERIVWSERQTLGLSAVCLGITSSFSLFTRQSDFLERKIVRKKT